MILYNCHHAGDEYRINKFNGGDFEASYLVSREGCQCPAGHRPSCRHRQMLPEMIDRGLVNSHLFLNWDHPSKPTCDFEGNVNTMTVIDEASPVKDEIWLGFNPVVPEGQHVEEDTKPALFVEMPLGIPEREGIKYPIASAAPKPFRRI